MASITHQASLPARPASGKAESVRSARRKGRPNAPACEHGHLARKLRVLEERLGVIESTIGLEEPLKVIRIA